MAVKALLSTSSRQMAISSSSLQGYSFCPAWARKQLVNCRASLAWVVSDRWLQVVVSMLRADSQQGPYLGRLALSESCWYCDWPEERAVWSGGEREVVRRGRGNSNNSSMLGNISSLVEVNQANISL